MGNTPNIRFKGFTDDWEQRKLSEVAEIVGGGTPSTNIPEYWDGDIDWYAPAEINDQIYVDGSERKITKLGLEKSSAKILPADITVLFTSRAGIGKTAILRRSGATNQGFQSMVLNDETNPYFVFSISKFIKEEAERVASGSTFAEVSGKMLGNLAFMFPTKKEQDKIGEYFSNLDNLITLHQRKCDETKKLKKFMLQKMFPKKDAKKPEIRFAGFTDDWEQRKLSEVAEIVGGGTPSTNIPEYWDGDIDWYAPAEINDQIYVDGSERKITKLGLEKSSAKILPADITVLFTSRAGIGKTAILRRSGATNQGFQSMVLNDETNPYFVFSISKFIKEEAERVASGSTFAEVSGKMLGNLAFMFPTKKEQDKIGEYFSNLDNLITLHQRKCDELKEFKKYMLQNMFPQKG